MTFEYDPHEYDPRMFTAKERREIERQIDGRPRRVKRLHSVHSGPLDLVDRELEIVAATSAGRRAFDGFRFDLVRATDCQNLSQLARHLRCGPEGEMTSIGHVWALHHADESRELALVGLAALRPALERSLTLLDPHGLDEFAAGDLIAEFYLAIPMNTDHLNEFVAGIHRAARVGVRRRQRERTREVQLDDDYDAPSPDSDPAEIVGDLMGRLVESNVITHREAELLTRTRVYDEDLKVLAREWRVPYKTLQGQRWRCERRVAGFLRREELS